MPATAEDMSELDRQMAAWSGFALREMIRMVRVGVPVGAHAEGYLEYLASEHWQDGAARVRSG